MSTDLTEIQESLVEIDKDKLAEYSEKAKTIVIEGANTIRAPFLLSECIKALDLANKSLTIATRADSQAANAVKHAEAVAFLENATEYLQDRSIKVTDEAKKRYVPMDQGVIDALEVKAETAAILTFVKNLYYAFRLAHDDVKKVAYANDYNHNTQYEGM